MKLTLVRHGRPDEDDAERPHDPRLRAEGWQQAEAVGRMLAAEGVTRIVSSPQQRALQTSEPLSRRLGLPVEMIDGWAEADRHLPRYRSVETLRAEGPDAWQRFLADPVRTLGSDPDEFRAAVLGALATVLSAADGHVVVFTHGLPINLVLSHVLGLQRIVHFQPGYASVTRLRARDAHTLGVISVNESGHHAWPPEPSP